MALIRHLAALRPGPILSVTASAKGALRAIARRWLTLDAEIRAHDADLEALTASCVPAMLEAHGSPQGPPPRCSSSSATIPNASVPRPLSPNSAASVRFQPRAAKRTAIASIGRQPTGQCCPVSGRDRRMRNHQPTLDYVKKRKADGKGKMEIIRCLKRFVAREIFGYLCGAQRSVPSISKAT